MAYYVYILQSEIDNSYYKGFSEHPLLRLEQHNTGESHYTSTKKPWKLVCLLKFETKSEALTKEKKLKKYSEASLRALIESSQNILNTK